MRAWYARISSRPGHSSGMSECAWQWSGLSTSGSMPRSKMRAYADGSVGLASRPHASDAAAIVLVS
jgi:hypothetical protein